MNRIYAIMLALLLGACWNDSPEEAAADSTASQGGSAEKVYSLEGHPLAKYNTAADVHIITFNFPAGGTMGDRSFSPFVFNLTDSCTKSVLQQWCETPRDQYIREAKEESFTGAWLEAVAQEYDEKCAPENIKEGIERDCQTTIDKALYRLQIIGRTDVTEAHLRNPAFWQLQARVIAETKQQGVNAEAEERVKQFEAGSY